MFGVAQIEMRIEIENADPWLRVFAAQVIEQTTEAGKGDFVPATQAQR